MLARVELLLAGAQVQAALQAHGVVTQTVDGLELALKLRTSEGERRLHAANCEQIAEATAVVVAFAYDRLALSTPTKVDPTPLPVSQQTPAPPSQDAVAQEENPADGTWWANLDRRAASRSWW